MLFTVGSWRSVQASWASIFSIVSADGCPPSPESRMSATPSSEIVTPTEISSPAGMKLWMTCERPGEGPASSAWVSVEGSWSPRGTNTGSGVRIAAVGSK